MEIREYKEEDLKEILNLFYDSVHNTRYYTKEQKDAWASGKEDFLKWNKSFLEKYTIVVVSENKILGFGNIDHLGYLDMLYVHKDYQGKGIGNLICDCLETKFETERIYVHASIDAKPFFENRGYKVIKEQEVLRHGIKLKNYVMEKYK